MKLFVNLPATHSETDQLFSRSAYTGTIAQQQSASAYKVEVMPPSGAQTDARKKFRRRQSDLNNKTSHAEQSPTRSCATKSGKVNRQRAIYSYNRTVTALNADLTLNKVV